MPKWLVTTVVVSVAGLALIGMIAWLDNVEHLVDPKLHADVHGEVVKIVLPLADRR